jgi:hypothetical protein
VTRTQPWLESFPWETIVAQNAVLCRAKGALHRPTSEGYEKTRDLWVQSYRQSMTLDEAVFLCCQCHRQAPFCFYNGNTFASVIALVIKRLDLDPIQAHVVRSLACHIVAGVSSVEEEESFRRYCESISG